MDKEDLIKLIIEKKKHAFYVFIDQAASGLGVELLDDLIIYLTKNC